MPHRLKYKWKKMLVMWRQWQDSLNDSISIEREKITPNEEKAIRLWKLCLKDENSVLAYNNTGVRHIEKDNILIILHPSGNLYYIMTIMDINTSGNALYEINIPKKEAQDVCDSFDNELEKRMKKVENSKRRLIENDLDKLLNQNLKKEILVK